MPDLWFYGVLNFLKKWRGSSSLLYATFPIFPLCARFSPTLTRRFNRRTNGSIDSHTNVPIDSHTNGSIASPMALSTLTRRFNRRHVGLSSLSALGHQVRVHSSPKDRINQSFYHQSIPERATEQGTTHNLQIERHHATRWPERAQTHREGRPNKKGKQKRHTEAA